MATSFSRFLDTPQSDSYEQVISSSQRPLPDNTHNRQISMPPRWDSNPQSQQMSGRRPTPETARPMGPAQYVSTNAIYYFDTIPHILIELNRSSMTPTNTPLIYTNTICFIAANVNHVGFTNFDKNSIFKLTVYLNTKKYFFIYNSTKYCTILIP